MKNDRKKVSIDTGRMGYRPHSEAARAKWDKLYSQRRKWEGYHPAKFEGCQLSAKARLQYPGYPVPYHLANSMDFAPAIGKVGDTFAGSSGFHSMDYEGSPRRKTTEEMIIDQTNSMKEIMYQLRVAAKRLKAEHEALETQRQKVDQAFVNFDQKVRGINEEKSQVIALAGGCSQDILNVIAKANRKIWKAEETVHQEEATMHLISDGMDEIKAKYAELLEAMEIQLVNAKNLVNAG